MPRGARRKLRRRPALAMPGGKVPRYKPSQSMPGGPVSYTKLGEGPDWIKFGVDHPGAQISQPARGAKLLNGKLLKNLNKKIY